MNDAAKVPSSGLNTVMLNVLKCESPIILDTTMNFLSMALSQQMVDF